MLISNSIYKDLLIIYIHLKNNRFDNIRKFIKKTIEVPFLEKVLESNSYHLDEDLHKSFVETLDQLKKSDSKTFYSYLKYLSFFDYEVENNILEKYIYDEISKDHDNLELYTDVVFGYPMANLWSVDVFNKYGQKKYYEYMNRYFDFFHKKENTLNLVSVVTQAFPYKHKKLIYDDILDLKKKLITENKKLHFFNLCEFNQLIGISVKGEKILDSSCFKKKRGFYIQELKKNNSTAMKNYVIYKLMKMGDLNSTYLSYL